MLIWPHFRFLVRDPYKHFVGFLVDLKTPKSRSEINWPFKGYEKYPLQCKQCPKRFTSDILQGFHVKVYHNAHFQVTWSSYHTPKTPKVVVFHLLFIIKTDCQPSSWMTLSLLFYRFCCLFVKICAEFWKSITKFTKLFLGSGDSIGKQFLYWIHFTSLSRFENNFNLKIHLTLRHFFSLSCF